MNTVVKLTQGYSAEEDRLFLDAQLADAEPQRLWLTQRLTGVLVRHLCDWLDQHLAQTASGHHDHRLHSFEQQSALAALQPDAAVAPGRHECRVDSIDLDRGSQAIRLSFKPADLANGVSCMTLDAIQLRQWLAILHELYGKAGWPTTVWPVWMSAPQRPAGAPVSTVQLH